MFIVFSTTPKNSRHSAKQSRASSDNKTTHMKIPLTRLPANRKFHFCEIRCQADTQHQCCQQTDINIYVL